MPRTNRLAARLGLLLTLALAVVLTGCRAEAYTFHGGEIDPPAAAAPIQLTDQHGAPFDLAAQEGNVVLLYFGYTTCPDACPVTLSDWITVKEELGEDADRVRFAMVTVDPERDTAAKLEQYLRFFDPSFLGLWGSPEQIEAVKQGYGVIAKRVEYPESATKYLVDHSTRTYVIDTEGRLRLTYPHAADPTLIAEDLRHLL